MSQFDFDPSIFELEDWIVESRPALYEATRYLHIDVQYDCWLGEYRRAFKKTID